ncbi:MAG: DoxX family protein [Flavobacterium sp. MedPE-SWcel]|uniref:DoxX family protein n=1 Tax=uncultured Flavobacterium sp. TaxID=165435 RepID=UPI000911270B|nr:DoxX family protein [uncultured Flavobacterium sp.]OIQ16226.1 MAG: DoxX family protein [Flavobacterium sp. MedPE-SWcel]
MMKFFTTSYNQNLYDITLLLLRITVGCFMIAHGLQKLDVLMEGGIIEFPDPMGVGAQASLGLAVFAELICSFLILIGLATRLATIPLIITMIVAVFVIHGNDTFNHKELPSLYLAVYVLLLILGSGKFSIDSLIAGKNRRTNY